MRISRLISAGLLCVLAVTVTADDRNVYRWTDSEGKVHYSDRPVVDDAARLDITSKATDNARITEQRQARIEKATQATAAVSNGETPAEPTEDPQAAAARYAENCKRATAALQSIVNARRLYVPTDDGSRRYLDESETNARRSKAEADVAEWCG